MVVVVEGDKRRCMIIDGVWTAVSRFGSQPYVALRKDLDNNKNSAVVVPSYVTGENA